MQSLKTKYFLTSKKVEVVRQRGTLKNKIWSEIIYRVLIFEKLFGIPLRGASNNALLGLIKPPAMRVVMTFSNRLLISSSLDIFVFSKYLLNLFFNISCFGSKMIKMFPGESFCGFSNPFQAFHGEQINTFSRRLVSNVFSPDSTRGYSRLCLEDKNY